MALVAVSSLLLLVTPISYALSGHGTASRVLFWLGLGGENNIGAWWSGMLLAVAAILAFDGSCNSGKSLRERRGWLALGFALLLLSFDEVASLHEYLAGRGLAYLALLGVVGLALAGYALAQLHYARVPPRVLGTLLVAFGLLASVPIHEHLQNVLEWREPIARGIRTLLEEGTEVIAMLLFVSATRANSVSLSRASNDVLVAPVQWRRRITAAATLLWPILTAATFLLPSPGGPADWLAALLFLVCALLAVRMAVHRGRIDSRLMALMAVYVGASAAANAVPFEWNPALFGVPVNLRGIVFALLLVAAGATQRANGRRVDLVRCFLIAAVLAACAVVWPTSQLLWCALPPAFALWLYSIESRAAAPRRSWVTANMEAPPVHAPLTGS